MEIAVTSILLGIALGIWIGSHLGANKFTSTAHEPYGVEWNGKVYDVTERDITSPVKSAPPVDTAARIQVNRAWEIIGEIGWGVKTVDYKHLRKIMDTVYKSENDALQSFVKEKREQLVKRLNEYAERVGSKRTYYGVSDDSFWDLTAHIVGLGRAKYNEVFAKPKIAKQMAADKAYKENFQYIFR